MRVAQLVWHWCEARYGGWTPHEHVHTCMIKSCIHEHHVSKDFWTPVINEVLVCIQESENPHDLYTVAVMKGSLVVGHMPIKISAVCLQFLPTGTITAIVRDSCEKWHMCIQ